MLRIIAIGLGLFLFSSALASETSNHWAFRPLQDSSPPALDDDWIRTPVDAFILKRLREENLSPSQPASSREFARRASVALTGLPPNYHDFATLSDSSEDSDNQFVDRLLASPQFGVRWGRYWLDIARYSDTKGYAYAVEQPDFFHAWRYRDWVVDAFNADLPYDAFIERQIAADRLLEDGHCDSEDLAAMGFLTLGRRFLGVEQDIIDDRIDIVTRGLLGLTAACARCHDHKFDPIPTEDYYALYGIFKSSRERLTPLASDASQDPDLVKLRAELDAVFSKEAKATESAFLKRADDYLVASLDLSKVPRPAFTEIVLPEAVNPAQIRRWHEYLAQSNKKTDPVFAPWKALENAPGEEFQEILQKLANQREVNSVVLACLQQPPIIAEMEDVALRYAEIFKEAASKDPANAAWKEIRDAMEAPDSPFVIPRTHPHDVEWLFHNKALNAVKGAYAKVERKIVALRNDARFTIALEDRPVSQNMRVLLRGDYCTQGEEVPRGSLSLLSNRKPVESGSGRLSMARSITDPSNPLTARVIVNRIWHHYFGTGLVATTSDFGLRADPASHPELLDYLARRLIENDWSLKSIHHLIAKSATFRQRAGVAGATDPENRLLSHFPRQRLDFESMRDALLLASGELDLRLNGPPGELLGSTPSPRRSIYGKIDRKFLPTTLQVFDFANPELHSPGRYETNVPQQALFFLNSPFTIERARALVRNIDAGSPEYQVKQMFRAIYQRDPTAKQLAASLEFLRNSYTKPKEPVVSSAWQYGYGKADQENRAVTGFTELPHFNGNHWSGGTDWPDPTLGWVRLTAEGGHVGNTPNHAAIRRWIAPEDAIVRIKGTVEKIEECGDGLRAFIVGPNATFEAFHVEFGTASPAEIDRVLVKAGDTIDFIADCGEKSDFLCDGFRWTIQIEQLEKKDDAHKWISTREFGGNAKLPEQLTNWERLAQALLLSNEFMFVD